MRWANDATTADSTAYSMLSLCATRERALHAVVTA